MTDAEEPAAVALTWWQCEPRRLARDQAEVLDRFPELTWAADSAGGWRGYLPQWPFDRPEPDGLAEMIGVLLPAAQRSNEYAHKPRS